MLHRLKIAASVLVLAAVSNDPNQLAMRFPFAGL